MALRVILSWESVAFTPPTVETNTHFIGKYNSTKLIYIRDHRQFQNYIETLSLVPASPSFIGKYRSTKYTFLLNLRQLQDSAVSVSSGFGPDLPYTIATGITAAGTTQGTATALSAQDNEVTTSSATSAPFNGVRITLATPGIPTTVHNYSNNDIYVYPPVGGQINKIGVNTPYIVTSGSSMDFRCMSTTQWYSTSP